VAGEGRRREQPWQSTFRLVRSALEQRGVSGAWALFNTVTAAYQTTKAYQKHLSFLGPNRLEESTFDDWREFLYQLYEETSNLYIRRASLIPEENFQAKFEEIKNATRGSLLQLQDMHSKNPPTREDREDLLRDFEKLINILEATRNGLGSLPTVQEANEVPVNVIWQEPAYVPLVGRIAAGDPILAVESVEDIFPLPRRIVGEGTLFVLEVAGDSMIDAAIANGDWVVVRQQKVAENGEIVAASLNDEVTIKTLRRAADGHVWLIPQNQNYDAIPGDHATILGKVVAVLRRA
jgi:SOS regulatory protein LexA